MAENPQSRKWALTVNNPAECGLNRDGITEIIMRFSPTYACLADEIASTGTPHTHIFLYSESPIRFSTVKNRFPTAHIEKALGTVRENRDYILKTGKWAGTEKAETSVEGSFAEFGEIPTEGEEKNPAMFHLLQNVREGLSNREIVEDTPSLAFKIREIDVLRDTYLFDEYRSKNRELTVSYLYGATGSGKTSGIYREYPSSSICRITDYHRNGVRFDAYHGEDVLVFEEFHSQVPLPQMLSFLDIYPLYLPARYNDRIACYTKVYITSNLPLEEQYQKEQREKSEAWRAFRRRIHHVIRYDADHSRHEIEQEANTDER